MRPVLGSTTTTLPLKLPSASVAAVLTSRSSPMGLSPAAGSPKELTCQGLQAVACLRPRLWLPCGIVVCPDTDVVCATEVDFFLVAVAAPVSAGDVVCAVEVGFFLVAVAALRAPPTQQRNKLTSARRTRPLIDLLPPNPSSSIPAGPGASQPGSFTSLLPVPLGRFPRRPTPPE